MDHKLTGQEENGNTGLHYERRECSERKIQYSTAPLKSEATKYQTLTLISSFSAASNCVVLHDILVISFTRIQYQKSRVESIRWKRFW
jgi:hypothetical protein